MALSLNFNVLGRLYPAYLVTDYDFRIRSVGPSITRAFPDVAAGDILWDHFTAERPIGQFDVTRLLKTREQVWLLGLHGLKLRGVIVDQADELFFLVNYAPASLRSDAGYQLQMWDFSPADATLDALIAVEVQKALIAETQDLLKELSAARDAAEASQAETEDYYSAVIRTLWTPAQGIGGAGRLVESAAGIEPGGTVEDFVQKSGDEVYTIMDDLLRDAEARRDARRTTLDPLATIAEAALSRETLFRAKGVAFQFDVDGTGGQLCLGDAQALRGVVISMLEHGLERTDRGWVKLHAVVVPDGPLLRLRVECMDTGDPAAPPQGDAGAAAAIAAGGHLERFTLAGVGVKTEFQVAYTRAKAVARGTAAHRHAEMAVAVSDGARAPHPATAPDQPLRLLVVCANLIDRRLIEALLAPPKVALVVAESDSEAMSLWRDEPFDAAFLDLQALDCDGLTTARKMRDVERDAARPPAPIVIMSHQVVLDHLDVEATAHVNAFLTKPISPTDLTDILASVVGRAV